MNCKRAFFLIVLFSFFAFCGCKNFLNGKEVLSEINQSVEYANASETTVVVTTNYGNVLNNGERKLKKGDTLQLNYSEGTSGYQFVKWDVEPAKSVSFVEAGGINLEAASVKIENTSQKITIKPVLYERPKIDTSKTLPAFVKSGVEKNSSIYFTFTKKLSADNDFNRINIEMVSSVEGQNTKLFGNENSALDNFMLPTVDNYELTIAAKRDNYISLMNDVETIRVTIPADFYYEIDGYKICFGAEQSYSYIINNQTVEKLEVSVSCEGGTISPNQRLTYSIGSHFDVIFTKSDEFIYNDWSVTAGGYIVEKCPNDEKDIAGYYKAWLKSETGEKTGEPITFLWYNKPDAATKIILESQNMYKIEFTVLENLSGVSIKPNTILMPKISDYEPKYVNTGNDYDTNINVYFNKEMDVNTFTTSNIEIKDNQDKKDYSKYFSFKASTDNGKTTLTIIPSYDIKELFTASKTQIDIEIALTNDVKDLDGESVSGTISWYYRIINQAEKVAPVITDIHLYSDSDPNAHFYRELTQKPVSDWSKESEYDKDVPTTYLQYGDFTRNYVNNIYICTQVYDDEGSLNKLRVKEISDSGDEQTEYYVNNGYLRKENGHVIYEHKIMHEFKTKIDDYITLKISYIDKAGNESNSEYYTLFKCTKKESQLYIEQRKNNFTCTEEELNLASEETEFEIDWNFESTKKNIECICDLDEVVNRFSDVATNDMLALKFPDEKNSPSYYPLAPIIKIELTNNNSKEIIFYGLFNSIIKVKEEIKNVVIDNSIDNIFTITFYHVNGTVCNDSFKIPAYSDKVQIQEIDGKLYILTVIAEKVNNIYEGTFIYYKTSDNQFSKQGILGEDQPLDLDISDIYGYNESDEIVFYIEKFCTNTNGIYEYESLPRKYILNKKKNQNIDITFPAFLSDKKYDIEYPLNMGEANIILNIDSLNKNENVFLIKCKNKKDNQINIFRKKEFTVKSGFNYEISFITQNENGSCESDVIEVDAATEDNNRPEIPIVNFDFGQFAPNFYRVKNNTFSDYDEDNKEVHDFDFITLFPCSTTNMKEIQAALFRNDKGKISSLKKVICYLNNDYFDIPTFEKQYLVLEDKSGNYNYDVIFYKDEICNSIPIIKFNSENKNFLLKVDDKIELPDIPAGYRHALFYSIQNISLNNTSWSMCKEQTLMGYDSEVNWKEKEITMSNKEIANNFVRIFVKFASKCGDSNLKDGTKFLIPLYVCPGYLSGEVSCNNHSWLEVSNGYQIFADAPTLCHTMYYPEKLTETNTTEDAYVWESKAMETGIMVKDSMFSYSNDQTNGVPEGFYYATICHFADGTILMSDVKQK